MCAGFHSLVLHQLLRHPLQVLPSELHVPSLPLYLKADVVVCKVRHAVAKNVALLHCDTEPQLDSHSVLAPLTELSVLHYGLRLQ